MVENDQTKTEEGGTAGKYAGVPSQKKPSLEEAIGMIPLADAAGDERVPVLDASANRSFPKPSELAPIENKDERITPKVSLKDIPLPEYMKGGSTSSVQAVPPKNPAPVSTSRAFYEEHQSHIETPLERSIREIGARAETGPNAKKIVAVSASHRTELDENGLPRIRTYAADISAEIEKRGATLASIAGAEREREIEKVQKEKIEETKRARTRALMFGVGALTLLVTGIVIVFLTFYLSRAPEPQAERVSIIPVNKRIVLELPENASLTKLLASERTNSTLALGEIQEIIVMRDGRELTGEEVLDILGAPDVLTRNVSQVFIGLHAFDRNQPLIIATVSTYDLAFDAMLVWEDRMAETLQDFFAPLTKQTGFPPLKFTDRVFRNLDLRESQAEWLVIYTFPDRETLLMTTNESTLKEALTRLSISKTRPIQ